MHSGKTRRASPKPFGGAMGGGTQSFRGGLQGTLSVQTLPSFPKLEVRGQRPPPTLSQAAQCFKDILNMLSICNH